MIRTLAPATITLPTGGGTLEEYVVTTQEPLRPQPAPPFKTRVAFAAPHVVADPLATVDPVNNAAIDMPATLAQRRRLWSLGFGVAEAMDTAQRGMGLDWTAAKELIRHSCAEAKAQGASIACGANTDQIAPRGTPDIEQVAAAYDEQCEFIQRCGGRVILMASRVLAGCARNSDDYLRVYRRLLGQSDQPVILHWLGEAFDPTLRGYWGGSTVDDCMAVCLQLIHEERKAIDGIKISLLDKDREIEMRRQLPAGVRMYTGDDFHYAELIEGDKAGWSDALLGIFDGIAPAAALALRALDSGDLAEYRDHLLPTLPLSRHIFQTPTCYYKTGLVFLGYLNGYQSHFRMLGGQESARSIVHLATLFRYADQARLLSDPDMALSRMRQVLALSGVC